MMSDNKNDQIKKNKDDVR